MPVQNIDLANVTSVNYDGTALTQVIFDGYEIWPNMLYQQGYYGVESPELQWVMSAQGGANISANTPIDLSNGNETVYTGTWTSLYSSAVNTYTNSSGDTKYYLPLPARTNLKTSVATSSNADIISNGGFTLWVTFIPYASSSGWCRLWNYYNLASVTTGSSIGDTHEFAGPLVFYNRSGSYGEFRRPAYSSSYGDAHNINPLTPSTTGTCTLLIRMSNNGTGHKWVRNGSYSLNNASMSFGSSGGYGIRTTANSATPVFADAYYNYSTFNGVMESGFANRPFTDAECLTLVDGLNDEFKR
jgi:hypothetical protein